MSVATKNPFALLDAEDASRPASPAPKAGARAPQAQAPTANRSNQKTRGGPASRGGKYYARGGGTRQAPKDSNQGASEEPVGGEGPRKFEGRGRGRGGGGGSGGGGRGGPGRGGRRPFDRHSQTGKTDSEKKIQNSWGGADGNTELKAEQQATVDAATEGKNEWDETGAADWGAPATDAPGEGAPAEGEKPEGRPRREREPEEEDNTLTLEQYLAQQKEKETSVPKLEGVRQVSEATWKDAVPLSKEGEESYFVGKTKSAPKPKAKKEERVFIEIDAAFPRPDRGGRGRGRGGERGHGGRGGRGGGRGGGGRGRGSNQAAVDVDDQAAFPSLS